MDPWLDDLSEDWVSQPRSSSPASLIGSTPAGLNCSSIAGNISASKIPRYKPRRKTMAACGGGKVSVLGSIRETTHDGNDSSGVLAERSFSDLNIPPQRGLNQPLKLTDGERGRTLSRAVSASSTRTTINHTLQRKAQSSSPQKDRRYHETPEWKRRLLGTDVRYGEQRDLFSPIGLENIFRPPPPQQTPIVGKQEEVSYIPSSPPPYPSHVRQNAVDSSLVEEHKYVGGDKLGPLDEEDEDGMASRDESESGRPNSIKERNEPEQISTRQAGESSNFSPIATSTWRENRASNTPSLFHMHHVGGGDQYEQPPVTAYRLESKSDKPDEGLLQGEVERSACGQDEEINEGISPIFISRHNTADGRVGYAAFSSPNRGTRRKPAVLVTSNSNGPGKGSPALPEPKSADRFILSDPDGHSGSTSQIFPDDLSTGTQDFVAKGGFIGLRRGGYSDEGSFQQRNLSPSSLHPTDAPQLAKDESCEFSSSDELPQIRRLRPPTDESPALPPAAPSPPIAPTTPNQTKGHKDGESGGASKSSGSPLKLFGNYDTFTNEKLLRRMSQLEDSFLGDESDDDSNISRADHASEADEASLGYPGLRPNLQEGQAQGLRNSSFGVGELDNYEFREHSLVSSQPDDYDEDGENKPPLPELNPGVHTSFPLRPYALTEGKGKNHSKGFKITTIQTSITTKERTTRVRTSTNHQNTEAPHRLRISHGNPCVELGSGIGEDKRRDASYSPVKDRTPKRRRTLNVQELDVPVDNEVPKATMGSARHIQSIIGRKRKDARYEKDNNKPVNPDVVAMRQILRPRTPTPSQIRARHRQATRNADNSKSPSPRRQTGQRENENEVETKVSVAVGGKTSADEVAVVSTGPHMVNESRKGSVTTQDFLDEALKVMDMIRAKGKPGSGLASVDESEEEGERKLVNEQILMGEDSTQEEFDRPPSREYHSGPTRKLGINHDARVASHLRKYEDTTNMDDITASLNSLNILRATNTVQHTLEVEEEIQCDPPNIRITENPSQRKRKHSSSSAQSQHSQPSNPAVRSHGSQSSTASSYTRRTRSIPTGSSARSEILQVIPPHKVSHLIPGQVAGMVYDRTSNLWIKRRNVDGRSESETTEEDPFGGIPDLSVNEAEELERIKLAAEQSRHALDRTGAPSPPAEQIERAYSKDGDINYRFPIDTQEVEETAETSSTPSRNSRLASSGPQPETRATSWGESPPDVLTRSRQSKHQIHASADKSRAREGQDEEAEHEIQVHEGRGEAGNNQSISGQHRRGLHIAFSSPLVSLRHRGNGGTLEPMVDIWNDESQLDNEDSGIDEFLELGHSSLSLQSSSRRMSFGFAPRSAYRGAARRISIDGRSFSARLFSRIDEQNEESLSPSQRNHASRRASLGVAISTPIPLRDLPGSSSMPPPTTGRRANVSFHLSPLPKFSVDPVDDAYALEVSYIAQLRGDISLQGIECSFSLATEELVKKLTDVEPYEPYWEYIRQIDLRQKGLITLHMLNDFCPRIEELDVSDNEIGQLSGAPPGIRNLKITNNCLSNLTAWGHLTNLQYLDVSGNEMDNLLGFSGLKHLRELKADDNEIKSLDGIYELDGLISLSVRNNRLEMVDFEKSELKRLSTLDLRGNKIREVRNLHNLAALTRLNLEDNSLQEFTLPRASQMECLSSLRLSKNKLRSIDVSCFPGLRILYLDENQLGKVGGLQSAKHLDSLSMREQASGPEDYSSLNVDDCFEVRKLYASGNLFPSFTPKLDFLNLQYLELANAGLTTLPAHFGSMLQNARVLNLNFNALSDIRPLQGIKRLKKLLLAGNRLTRLRKTTSVLAKLHNLSEIDLRNNPLTVGFYLAVTESRLVRNPKEHPHPDVSPFSLPTADKEADVPYRARLDEDTKLKRKVYEMLIGFGCPYLKELDGMVFERDQVLMRDKTWERLKQLGIVRLTGNECEGREVISASPDMGAGEEICPLEKDEISDKEIPADAGSGADTNTKIIPCENEPVADAGSHEAIGGKIASPEIEIVDGEVALAGTESITKTTTFPGEGTADAKEPVADPTSSEVAVAGDTALVKETLHQKEAVTDGQS